MEPRFLFGEVAKLIWPRKTAAELASRTNVSERAAKHWLAQQREPSHAAYRALFDEIDGTARARRH